MLKNKKIQMICSLLIGICVWAYVMGQVDPQATITVTDINVEMQGTESLENAGLEATLLRPKTINATITGKRSEVNKAKKEGLEAYVDVSTCEYGENEVEIKLSLPDDVSGVTVDHLSQYSATFNVK